MNGVNVWRMAIPSMKLKSRYKVYLAPLTSTSSPLLYPMAEQDNLQVISDFGCGHTAVWNERSHENVPAAQPAVSHCWQLSALISEAIAKILQYKHNSSFHQDRMPIFK